MSKDDGFKAAIAMIGLGGWGFYQGLLKQKLRRRISDIPRSKIASAALGHSVEVQAKVICHASDQIVSPLSEQRCATFIWSLEEERGSGKNRSWHHLYNFYSTPYIYIVDESNEIAAIDLAHCELQDDSWGMTEVFNSNSFNIPNKVKDLLTRHDMVPRESSWLTSSKYRLREKLFVPDENLYVLGAAIPMPKHEASIDPDNNARFGERGIDLTVKVAETFRVEQNDNYVISNYDENRNLVLDKSEKEALYRDIEKRILKEYGKEVKNEYLFISKFLFTEASENEVFFKLNKVYLSNKSESDLISNLSWKILLGLYGGPILVTLGVWYFVAKFG